MAAGESMSDETTVVAAGDQTEEVKPVNPEESAVAETEKVGDEAAQQGTPKEGESEEQRSKRKGGWQRRIEKLERENEVLRELALTRPEKSEAKSEPEQKFSNPDPRDPMPDLDSFNGTLKEFNAELASWSIRQAKREFASEQAAKEQESSQKTQERKWYDAEASFSDEHEDYHDVSEAAVDAIRAISDQPGVQAIGAATTDPELGPALLYELGKNPAEIKRLAAMSPIRAAMELGKITSRLAQPEKAAEKEKKPPPVSKAPAPAKPVSKPSAAAKPFDPMDDSIPADEWVRLRNKQVAERQK